MGAPCLTYPCDHPRPLRRFLLAGQSTRRRPVALARTALYAIADCCRAYLLLQQRDQEVDIYATHSRYSTVPADSAAFVRALGRQLPIPAHTRHLQSTAADTGPDIWKCTAAIPSTDWRSAACERRTPRRIPWWPSQLPREAKGKGRQAEASSRHTKLCAMGVGENQVRA